MTISPQPEDRVTCGGRVHFGYSITGAVSRIIHMTWSFNGSSVKNLNNDRISEVVFDSGSHLEVENIPEEYNGTIIRCWAQFGANVNSTDEVILLVQCK